MALMSAPLTKRPLTPAMTSNWAAPRRSRGLRVVRSLRISLEMRDMTAPSARTGDVKERGLEGVPEPTERAVVAQPSFVDDRYPVDGLLDLAQYVAGEQDRSTLRREAAQERPKPGDAARV